LTLNPWRRAVINLPDLGKELRGLELMLSLSCEVRLREVGQVTSEKVVMQGIGDLPQSQLIIINWPRKAHKSLKRLDSVREVGSHVA